MAQRNKLGDMMNAMAFDVPSAEKLMKRPLAKVITFPANVCGYNGSTKYHIVNWTHLLFLKAKAAASNEDHLNWLEAMHGPFADRYWMASVLKLWKQWMHEKLLTVLKILLIPHRLGHSSWNVFQIDLSRSSILDFV